MFDRSTEAFTIKDKIEILLMKYDTLRDEILRRTSGGYQLIMVLAVILAAALGWKSQHGLGNTFWIAICVVVLSGFSFWGGTYRDTNLVALRAKDIEEIEEQVNCMADESFLRWETEFGGLNGKFWITRHRENRARETPPALLSHHFQQSANTEAASGQDVTHKGGSGDDILKGHLDAHIAEFNALSTKHVCSLSLSYSAWAGLAVYWAFLTTIYPRVPLGWILWAGVLGLEMAATSWYYNIADLYTNVFYLRARLRPQVQRLLASEDIWGYESFLISRRGHEKVYGDIWAFIFAMTGLLTCWISSPPSGWQWVLAIGSSVIMVWVIYLTSLLFVLRRQWRNLD